MRAGVAVDRVSRLTATDPRTIHRVYRHHGDEELLEAAARRRS
jgi:hypothetical protein